MERIDIDVDSITPTVLIYDRPASGLEAKFSMPFCAAAAVVHGRVGIDTFDETSLHDARVAQLMPRVAMHVDPSLDGKGPALTQARITITLRDGRKMSREANGARGYPERPANQDELAAKFTACARRALSEEAAFRALLVLRKIESLDDVRAEGFARP